MNVFEKIEAQQKGQENTPAWMVGEQLKEICADPACAALVAEDLDSRTIQTAADELKKEADRLHKEHRTNFVCITPNHADRILREFYGLPAAQEKHMTPEPVEAPVKAVEEPGTLDLFDFL